MIYWILRLGGDPTTPAQITVIVWLIAIGAALAAIVTKDPQLQIMLLIIAGITLVGRFAFNLWVS